MAFYLFFGALFPRNDFSQLLKVQDMWEHYQEHLLSSPEADWRSFLCEHFIHPEKHADDQHTNQHEELPLMSLSSFAPIFLLSPNLLFEPAPDQTNMPPLPAYLFSHISPYLNRIFHPPSQR